MAWDGMGHQKETHGISGVPLPGKGEFQIHQCEAAVDSSCPHCANLFTALCKKGHI